MAKTETLIDSGWFSHIRQCGGFVMMVNGEPELPSKRQISHYRLNRLVALGLLIPSDDVLFDGAPPQTYRIKEDTHVCSKQKPDPERPDPEN